MPSSSDHTTALIKATEELCNELEGLEFSLPTTHVYNPLRYAARPHESYLMRYGGSKKQMLFMGMNPGPWGMAQTGVPFGEIPAVRDWMGINGPVSKPESEHPKRPITGFDCEKSEVSGRRLWGYFATKYPKAADFFADHFVVNYCPLVFMEESGRNRTPDKLPIAEMSPIQEACDRYISRYIEILDPEWLIGVGGFAETALKRIVEGSGFDKKVARILHPSPASPVANRGWAEAAEKQLKALGLG